MPSQFDPTDFVDAEIDSARKSSYAAGSDFGRPANREEIDSKVTEAQVKLAELKRAQEELERERAALEEVRRRQIEFQTGREEMLQALTRGIGLLEEAEFAARRDAEQMAKTLTDFKESLRKVQVLHEESWSKENYSMELTRALTTVENARMEWNSARLKFTILGAAAQPNQEPAKPENVAALAEMSFLQLCKIGVALTWPIALVGASILAVLLLRG